MSFEQRSGLSKLRDYFFSFQTLNPSCSRALSCYNAGRMPPFTNLVSDSTLVQETIDLLRVSGGRANASQIVDVVFKVSHIDEELAGLLVSDLVRMIALQDHRRQHHRTAGI